MNRENNKGKANENEQQPQQQESGQESSVHFDQVNDTYGNEETQEDEAAAEQQRKEALTERD